jgi:tripartite-type tricarboxylate transporter receptor subunit TctC
LSPQHLRRHEDPPLLARARRFHAGRRSALRSLGALSAAAALAAATGAWPRAARAAGSFPDRPIRLYVGYSAGGGTDQVARLVAQKTSELIGQQVIVMNMPGATGSIAVEHVAGSAPDGYSLLLVSSADTVVPALRANLHYDFQRDLVGVAQAADGPMGLVVNNDLPVHNVSELIALARSEPGKLNFGSPGVGNSLHLAGAQMAAMTGIDIVHVPFKGGAESMTATAQGEVQMCFQMLATVLPFVNAGKLRLLAVTSAQRVGSLPNVPTLAESGLPGFDRSVWFGVAAPKGTPAAVIDKLNASIDKAMSSPASKDFLASQNLAHHNLTAEQFTQLMRRDARQGGKLIADLGIKPE